MDKGFKPKLGFVLLLIIHMYLDPRGNRASSLIIELPEPYMGASSLLASKRGWFFPLE